MWLIGIMILMLFQLTFVHSEQDNRLEDPPVVIREESRALLGLNIAASSRGFVVHDGVAHMVLSRNVSPASGNGDGLQYWRRDLNSDAAWQVNVFSDLAGKKVGMYDLIVGSCPQTVHLIYVDRTDESDRTVFLDVFQSGERKNLFTFNDGTGGVLNPVGLLTGDHQLDLFIPRRSQESIVRWFRIDLSNGEVSRFADITLDGPGARIYGATSHNDQVFVPVCVSGRLYLLTMDRYGSDYTVHIVDEFPHAEPPRQTRVHVYPELNVLLLTYLRPAPFSQRSETGLLGEIVVNAVDLETKNSLGTTVVGGYTAHQAGTHYMDSIKATDSTLALAYTAVDTVHLWSKEGKHGNYVYSRIALYTLTQSGEVQLASHWSTEPFWGVSMAASDQPGHLYLTYNSPTDNNEKWLSRLHISVAD